MVRLLRWVAVIGAVTAVVVTSWQEAAGAREPARAVPVCAASASPAGTGTGDASSGGPAVACPTRVPARAPRTTGARPYQPVAFVVLGLGLAIAAGMAVLVVMQRPRPEPVPSRARRR